ncbi:hypothetical protein PPACK8108_LOCUS14405 [Phakopsora pachyrhizi]|uniref:Uncharacterized protein n=1 Tax=Phakopsora pachyrhizi TaxID=170000 RepID=A0AAV0B4T9_PHAPC|nr:hypothetical protein PPACK8108_LOCUS14405 [Phakopsora pachyrhizi]
MRRDSRCSMKYFAKNKILVTVPKLATSSHDLEGTLATPLLSCQQKNIIKGFKLRLKSAIPEVESELICGTYGWKIKLEGIMGAEIHRMKPAKKSMDDHEISALEPEFHKVNPRQSSNLIKTWIKICSGLRMCLILKVRGAWYFFTSVVCRAKLHGFDSRQAIGAGFAKIVMCSADPSILNPPIFGDFRQLSEESTRLDDSEDISEDRVKDPTNDPSTHVPIGNGSKGKGIFGK